MQQRHEATRLAAAAHEGAVAATGTVLSDDELQAIDVAYHRKKTSGALRRAQDHRALEEQVQAMRCEGAL